MKKYFDIPAIHHNVEAKHFFPQTIDVDIDDDKLLRVKMAY
jgi:hypothetical protein